MNDLQPLIVESAQLMLIGMGSVFIILTLLIFLITLVSKLLAKFNPEDTSGISQPAYALARKSTSNPATDNELIAVISSAIASYRKRQSIN